MHEGLRISLRQAWRLIAVVVGFTLFGLGIVCLFLPGPGSLVLLAGLGILAGEFVWARWLLHRVKGVARKMWPWGKSTTP